MSSSSKTSPASKTGSSPEMSPDVAAEIARLMRGYRFVLSSTPYAYDPLTGTYATISATPTRPIEIIETNRKLIIRELRR